VQHRDPPRRRVVLQSSDHRDDVYPGQGATDHHQVCRPPRGVRPHHAPPGSLQVADALEALEVVDDAGDHDGRRSVGDAS
jgi:hypothetical protein